MYGHPGDQRKTETWRLLYHLHARASLHWLCIRDFNKILVSREKNGGTSKPLGPMQRFHDALHDCGLTDLGYQGYPFTWHNGRQGHAFVEVRLDRACANTKWRERFPMAKITHLQLSYSDQDPIMLSTTAATNQQRQFKKLQRFEERWVSKNECEERVQSSCT